MICHKNSLRNLATACALAFFLCHDAMWDIFWMRLDFSKLYSRLRFSCMIRDVKFTNFEKFLRFIFDHEFTFSNTVNFWRLMRSSGSDCSWLICRLSILICWDSKRRRNTRLAAFNIIFGRNRNFRLTSLHFQSFHLIVNDSLLHIYFGWCHLILIWVELIISLITADHL